MYTTNKENGQGNYVKNLLPLVNEIGNGNPGVTSIIGNIARELWGEKLFLDTKFEPTQAEKLFLYSATIDAFIEGNYAATSIISGLQTGEGYTGDTQKQWALMMKEREIKKS